MGNLCARIPNAVPKAQASPAFPKLDITIKMLGQRRPIFRILPQCPFAQIRQNRYAVQWVGTWPMGGHLLDTPPRSWVSAVDRATQWLTSGGRPTTLAPYREAVRGADTEH